MIFPNDLRPLLGRISEKTAKKKWMRSFLETVRYPGTLRRTFWWGSDKDIFIITKGSNFEPDFGSQMDVFLRITMGFEIEVGSDTQIRKPEKCTTEAGKVCMRWAFKHEQFIHDRTSKRCEIRCETQKRTSRNAQRKLEHLNKTVSFSVRPPTLY